MKLAVMQPYVYPYIGYFQLISAVDTFVFYDDVNYIKQGWINRNRVLVNGNGVTFTIPIEGMSSFKLIKDTIVHSKKYQEWRLRFYRMLELSYRRAPNFQAVFSLVRSTLDKDFKSIAALAEDSVKSVWDFLGYDPKFLRSSSDFSETRGLNKADRLIEISRRVGATDYVNPIGGIELYDRETFLKHGVRLSFLRTSARLSYKQGRVPAFVPGLSIIDVLMFNSPVEIKDLLQLYDLE